MVGVRSSGVGGVVVVAVAVAVALSGCGFHAAAPGGGSGDDTGSGADAGTMTAMIVDDSGSDFAAVVGGVLPELDDAIISARGTIEPNAYVLGGLHVRGYQQQLITAATTWATLTAALPAAPAGERYAEMPVTDWGGNWPRNVGLTSNNSFTVVYDGEILLAAGATMLNVTADDNAFFEISTDGGLTYAGIYDVEYGNGNGGKSFTVTPPAAGWYPIRGGLTQGGGDARVILSTVVGTTVTPIAPTALRARVTAAPGLLVSGFGTGLVFGYLGTALDPGPIAETFGTALPKYDLASPSNNTGNGSAMLANDFSLRYAGEVLIDTDGSYVLAAQILATASESYRLAIDGSVIASEGWPGAFAPSPSAPVHLAPGWHDVVLDYNHQNDNAAGVMLQIEPMGGAFATIDAAHLRPAVPRGPIAATWTNNNNVGQVTDAMPEVAKLTLIAPDVAVIDSVDFGFQLLTDRNNVGVKLGCTDGTDGFAVPMTAAYSSFGNGYDYTPGRTPFAGMPVDAATPWTLTFAKLAAGDGQSPQVGYPGITVTYHGGPAAPFAPTFRYVSSPRAVTGALHIDAVHLTADLRAATAKIELRSGIDATSLAAATWIDVTTAAPPPAPAALVQYRITITDDGWSLASFDKVEIDYTVPAGS